MEQDDFDADTVFDVTHHFDALYEGSTTNPFVGLSTHPGFMMPFVREDMEARLRVCIEGANKEHWALPQTLNGPSHTWDLLNLRKPTAKEAKALRLSDEVSKWAREAARIRAYLVHLDREAERDAKEERERKRENLKYRASVDPVAIRRLKRTMREHEGGAKRHKQRIEDERAFHEYQFAEQELERLEQKAAAAKRELEALD
jgi:hypothetical protein